MYLANIANTIPSIIPNSTSLGKWTNRYNLENATREENTITSNPIFLLYR